METSRVAITPAALPIYPISESTGGEFYVKRLVTFQLHTAPTERRARSHFARAQSATCDLNLISPRVNQTTLEPPRHLIKTTNTTRSTENTPINQQIWVKTILLDVPS